MRSVVIPDLHGHSEFLEQVLLAYPGRRFVLLGDYVDRGPDSPGVVRRVRELVEAGDAVALVGNHDLMMMQALLDRNEEIREVWLANGGHDTVRQYHAQHDTPQAARRAMLLDAEWMRAHLQSWVVEGDVLLAHAARPDLARPERLGYVWDRPGGDVHPLPAGCTVSVHGHTPTQILLDDDAPEPVVMDHGPLGVAWYIDVGVFFSGSLCVLDLEDMQPVLFQQDG